MTWRVRRARCPAATPGRTEDDPPPPRRDNLHATAQATNMAIKPRRFGDLKLFEPKTICPIIAVRDREER